MTNTAIAQPIATIADELEARSDGEYYVRVTERGWINLYAEPTRHLGGNAKLDFLRLLHDDGTWKVVHFTHNEVIKGEATFTHSLRWGIYELATGFFANL